VAKEPQKDAAAIHYENEIVTKKILCTHSILFKLYFKFVKEIRIIKNINMKILVCISHVPDTTSKLTLSMVISV
jgi:hypothetical protein